MSRALFMAKLKQGLTGLPQAEIDEIASDYEHHFAEAAAIGQSEDEVAAALGDPMWLARELRGDRQQRRSADEDPTPPAATPKAGLRPALLLAFLAVIALAVVAYYALGRDGGGSAPAAANSPAAPAPLPASQAAAGGARIVISGGQVLDLGTIAQDRIEIVLDGGGHATAKGRVHDLVVHIDGSGTADFGALQADTVHVDISGTGNAELWGVQMADIAISGSGIVRLKVKPKTLRQSVTGSGKVVLPN